MRRVLFFFLLTLSASRGVAEINTSELFSGWRYGGQLTPAATVLLGDSSTNVFGVGLGFSAGLFATTNDKKGWGLKFRLDRLQLHEDSINKTDTKLIRSGTILEFAEQAWTTFGVGVEWRWDKDFSELLVGYAFPHSGGISVISEQRDQPSQWVSVQTQSAPLISAGVGRRFHWKAITFEGTLRTIIILSAPYSSPLEGRTWVPIPFLFGLGVSY